MNTLFKSALTLIAVVGVSTAYASNPLPGGLQSYTLTDVQKNRVEGTNCVGLLPSGIDLQATTDINQNAYVSCQGPTGIAGGQRTPARVHVAHAGTDISNHLSDPSYIGRANVGTGSIPGAGTVLLFFLQPVF